MAITFRSSLPKEPDGTAHPANDYLPCHAATLGLDFFVEFPGPEWGFLGFNRMNHGTAGRQMWGFGLHVWCHPSGDPLGLADGTTAAELKASRRGHAR